MVSVLHPNLKRLGFFYACRGVMSGVLNFFSMQAAKTTGGERGGPWRCDGKGRCAYLSCLAGTSRRVHVVPGVWYRLCHARHPRERGVHRINAAVRYATYLVLLSAGHLVTQGEPDAVLHAAQLNRVFDVCTDRTHTADGTPVFVFYRDRHEDGEHR
jgi:hypothetical protein